MDDQRFWKASTNLLSLPLTVPFVLFSLLQPFLSTHSTIRTKEMANARQTGKPLSFEELFPPLSKRSTPVTSQRPSISHASGAPARQENQPIRISHASLSASMLQNAIYQQQEHLAKQQHKLNQQQQTPPAHDLPMASQRTQSNDAHAYNGAPPFDTNSQPLFERSHSNDAIKARSNAILRPPPNLPVPSSIASVSLLFDAAGPPLHTE